MDLTDLSCVVVVVVVVVLVVLVVVTLGRSNMLRESRLRRLTNGAERSLLHWTEGTPTFVPTYK